MDIDIYRSASRADKYLAVPSGVQLSTIQVTDPELTTVSPFKSALSINHGDKRIGLDAANVIAQINANGHAVFSASIVVKVAP